MSATKSVVLQGGPVRKQECYLSDPSAYIKLILWGSHSDIVEENWAHIFNKVIRVKVAKGKRYVNTPQNKDDCTITAAESFPESLPAVEVVATINEIIANILGVSYATKSCCSCSVGAAKCTKPESLQEPVVPTN